ncbi:hypothetical protein ACRC7T_05380 [Segnochrobactraceae bacterium EtOH-i3]
MMSGFMAGRSARTVVQGLGLALLIGAGLAATGSASAQMGKAAPDSQTVITITPPPQGNSSLPGVNLDTPGVLPSRPPVPGAPTYLNSVTGPVAAQALNAVPDGWVDGWHGAVGPGIPLPLPF